MNQKVYAPHVPSRYDPITEGRSPVVDLKPALRYGDIQPLVDLNIDVRETPMDELLHLIQEGISEITPNDYILCIGDPILIAAAIAYAMDQVGTAKVLRWDKLNRNYECVEVVL